MPRRATRNLEPFVRAMALAVLNVNLLATKRPRGRPRSNPETCSIRGCQEPARATTLCSTHYQRARRARLAQAS